MGRLVVIAVIAVLTHFGPRFLPSSPTKTSVELREPERSAPSSSDEQATVAEMRTLHQSSPQMPVLENLVNQLGREKERASSVQSGFAETWGALQARYRNHRAHVSKAIRLFCLIVFGIGFGAALLSQTWLARSAASFGYSASTFWLTLASLAAVPIALATHTSPWALFSSELLSAPLALLLGSAAVLKMVDFNYPLWNSTLRGVSWPLVSMVLIAIIPRL